MIEKLIVDNKDKLLKHKQRIGYNIQSNIIQLKDLLNHQDALTVFSKLKFDKVGVEPLTGQPENIIEVINQLQTYLVSIKAVEYLFDTYEEQSFCINWGNIAGYDIESLDGSIIAECFAATSFRSNAKLTADLKRLAKNQTAKYKYEFFFDMEFAEKHKTYYEEKYQGIQIIKFTEL